jgi:hypothetical protein
MNLLKQVAFNIYLAMLLTFWFLINLIVKPLAWIFYNTIRLISDFMFLISGKTLTINIEGDDDDEEI